MRQYSKIKCYEIHQPPPQQNFDSANHATFHLLIFTKVLLVLNLLLPWEGQAYNFTGSKWTLTTGASVPYKVNTTLSADLPDRACLDAIHEGFQAWTEISCSYIAWTEEGRTSNTAWGVDDQENVVSWRESSWDDSATALAITSSIFNFQGFIDTDIKFNGFHHTWAIVGEIGSGSDVESVTAHEVGHAIGLDHSSVSSATMWPSTGSNETSGRTLAQDDIDGACALYPSGGEAPVVPNDPPPMQMGTARFGESCAQENCVSPLFCVSDGVDQFCSDSCDTSHPCPMGYYCAQLSSGTGACAPGDSPELERVGFNEPCGEQIACEADLICINDGNSSYCSGPCDQGRCPEGMQCAGLQGGGDVCARGTEQAAPSFGELCEESGRCDEGLFCLNDSLYVSNVTGEPLPYCTYRCEQGCPQGYRCTEIQPSGDACQRIPTAGIRGIGDPCWQNPEMPYSDPSCGDELRCTGTQRDPSSQELITPGICTSTCTTDKCCPNGWGCSAITPFLALCREGVSDDEGFLCVGERPNLESPMQNEGGAEAELDGPRVLGGSEEDSGCQLLHIKERQRRERNVPPLFCLLIGFMIFSRWRVSLKVDRSPPRFKVDR